MEIKRGIMLHNGSTEDYDHVYINSGVIRHAQLDKHRVTYGDHSFFPMFEEDAFLPERTWRRLNDKEIAVLKPTEKRTDTNTIYIGNIPDDLKLLFEELELTQCKSREEVFARFRNAADLTMEINRSIGTFLQPRSNGKAWRFHYLGTNLPNLEVVACDTTLLPADHREEDKKYMGIHNDGTKYVSPHSLYRSGNRWTVNLGRETRCFLFLNLTLPQALNMLKQKIDVEKHKIDIINIAKYFFDYFPDYPVIKVEQQPYQYYIAPTDNCFHDGSTLGTKELDIIMVYFGSFRY